MKKHYDVNEHLKYIYSSLEGYEKWEDTDCFYNTVKDLKRYLEENTDVRNHNCQDGYMRVTNTPGIKFCFMIEIETETGRALHTCSFCPICGEEARNG